MIDPKSERAEALRNLRDEAQALVRESARLNTVALQLSAETARLHRDPEQTDPRQTLSAMGQARGFLATVNAAAAGAEEALSQLRFALIEP